MAKYTTGLHRYDAKRDANEPTIIDYFRWHGYSVEQISGKGVPDLLLGKDGKNYIVEVKGEGKNLNQNQKEWHANWLGQIAICRTTEDAQAFIDKWESESD